MNEWHFGSRKTRLYSKPQIFIARIIVWFENLQELISEYRFANACLKVRQKMEAEQEKADGDRITA